MSVESRRGHFVLAQLTREPFMIFFRIFRRKDVWADVDLANVPVLFCKAVTRQFLQKSRITRHDIAPHPTAVAPNRWIESRGDFGHVTVWPGTTYARKVPVLGHGGALVAKDVMGHQGGPYKHPSGTCDRIIKARLTDRRVIDAHELTSMAVFPATNERLYQCEQAGENVDPEKDLIFRRPLPACYRTYVDIVMASTAAEKKRLLRLFTAA